MADTAVLDSDTAPETSEAPEQELAPVAEIATPVEGTDSAEEQEQQPASPFSGRSLEEIEQDPEVQRLLKDKLAKQAESNRQKAEHAQRLALEKQQAETYLQMRSQAAQATWQDGHKQLSRAIKDSLSSGDDLNDEVVQRIAGNMTLRSLINANEVVGAAMADKFRADFPDFKVPMELNNRFVAAIQAMNPDQQISAYLDTMALAVREKVEKQVRDEIEAEMAASAQVEARKTAASKNAQAPRPSANPGAMTPTPRPASDLLSDPMTSMADKRRIYKDMYGIDLPA